MNINYSNYIPSPTSIQNQPLNEFTIDNAEVR